MRPKRLSMASNGQGPRQLTVRKGKVIPVSDNVSTVRASQLRASVLSQGESGNRLKSKFWRTGLLPSAYATAFVDLCRSSPPSDLEAQSEGSDTRDINAKVFRQLEEQVRALKNPLNTQPAENGKGVFASSRKITNSLIRAYKGAPALETVTIHIPSTPGARSATIRTLAHKKPTNTAQAKLPNRRATANQSADVPLVRKRHDERSTSHSALRRIPADAIGLAISTDSIHPDPSGRHEDRPLSGPRLSVMTNTSLGAFISADVSPTWTFANALAIPIVSSVTPPPAARTAARRLRSKYGRYPKLNHEKKLPTVPRSS